MILQYQLQDCSHYLSCIFTQSQSASFPFCERTKKNIFQEGRVHTSVCRYLLIKDSIRLHKFRFGAGLDSNVFNVVHPAIWKA